MPGPVLGMLGAQALIWALGCWGAVQDAGQLSGQDQLSALNAVLYSRPLAAGGGP